MSGFSRRDFVKSSVLTAAAAGAAAAQTEQQSRGFHPASAAGRGVKIACSTSLWRKQRGASLQRRLAGVAAAGYSWVEADSDELWDYHERPDDFKKLLDENNLGLVTVTVSGNFADRDQRLKNISRAVLTARALQALGSGILVLDGDWGNVPRQPRNFHIYSSDLAEIGALVYEETGLHCAYRFHEHEAADVRKIIATSDSRYVKFCFDTQYLTQVGIAPVPMIQAYGSRVIHIHLRDGQMKNGTWRDVPVGTGSIDPNPVLDALCNARYDGWVTIEQNEALASPAKDASKSFRNVQRQLEAAVLRSKDTLAERQEPAQRELNQPQPPSTRSMLQGLVMIGAAVGLKPAAFLSPAGFTPQDQTDPMQQMTHDMHAHRHRPIAPLEPKDPNFQPFFYTPEEYRDVTALADFIIPVTDTPGALDARADEYVDLMTWLDEDNHGSVRYQMARFHELCNSRYQQPFAALSGAQKTEFLNALTGASLSKEDHPALAYFNHVRSLTIRAYYASPQGLIQDLGYKGNTYVTEFKGCTHPEHQQ